MAVGRGAGPGTISGLNQFGGTNIAGVTSGGSGSLDSLGGFKEYTGYANGETETLDLTAETGERVEVDIEGLTVDTDTKGVSVDDKLEELKDDYESKLENEEKTKADGKVDGASVNEDKGIKKDNIENSNPDKIVGKSDAEKTGVTGGASGRADTKGVQGGDKGSSVSVETPGSGAGPEVVTPKGEGLGKTEPSGGVKVDGSAGVTPKLKVNNEAVISELVDTFNFRQVDADGNETIIEMNIEEFTDKMLKLGFNKEDISRIVLGELTLQQLLDEISIDKNNERRKAMMVAEYLTAAKLDYSNMDDLNVEIDSLLNELSQKKDNRNTLDDGLIDFMSSLVGIEEGIPVEDFSTRLAAWEYIDKFGEKQRIIVREGALFQIEDGVEYTDVTVEDMFGDNELFIEFKSLFEEYTYSNIFGSSQNYRIKDKVAYAAFIEKFNSLREDYLEERNDNLPKLEEEIKEIEGKLSSLMGLRDYINERVDHYFDNIDLYLLKDDFDDNKDFNNDWRKDIDAIINNEPINFYYDYSTIGSYLYVDTKEKLVNIIACMINGEVTVQYGTIYDNGNSINISSNQSMLSHYEKWQGHINEQEKAIFNYKYNVEGLDAAYQYLEDISNELDNRWLEKRTMDDQKWASEHPFLASIGSIVITPFEGLIAACFSFNAVVMNEKIRRADVYSSGTVWRAQVAADIAVNHGETLSFLYSTGMSMADTGLLIATTIATGGVATPLISAVLMGSRSYVATLNDALDRGLSDGQAVALAFVSAAVETAMESYSVGHLMNLESKLSGTVLKLTTKIANGVKNESLGKFLAKGFYIVAGAVCQGIAEGEEEFTTEILNYAADIIVSGDLSNHRMTLNSYVENGYSSNQAYLATVIDFANNLKMAFLGGFVSGVCFGAFGGTNATRKTSIAVAQNLYGQLEGNAAQQFTKGLEINEVQRQILEDAHQKIKDGLELTFEEALLITTGTVENTAKQLMKDIRLGKYKALISNVKGIFNPNGLQVPTIETTVNNNSGIDTTTAESLQDSKVSVTPTFSDIVSSYLGDTESDTQNTTSKPTVNNYGLLNINPVNYVSELLKNDEAVIVEAKKTAQISARKGISGEEITTIMSNGLVETAGVVKLNEELGETEWVVTNPSGESYIVPHDKFIKKYEANLEEPGTFKPISEPILAVKIPDSVSFMASWGEQMNIAQGGYLVINPDANIYGIQEVEFGETYQTLDIELPKIFSNISFGDLSKIEKTDIPKSFSNVAQFKQAYILHLIKTGDINNFNSFDILGVISDPVIHAALIGTDVLTEFYKEEIFPQLQSLGIHMSSLNSFDFNRLMEIPAIKETIENMSPSELAVFTNSFTQDLTHNLNWLSNDLIVDKIVDFSVTEFYDFLSNLRTSVDSYFIYKKDKTKYLKILNAINTKFYTEDLVLKNPQYDRLINKLLVDSDYFEYDNNLGLDLVTEIKMRRKAFSEMQIQKYLDKVNPDLQLDVKIDRYSGLDVSMAIDENYKYYDIKMEIDGEIKVITESVWWGSKFSLLSPYSLDTEKSLKIIDGNYKLLDVTPNIIKSKLYLDQTKGVQPGLNEITFLIDGIKKTVVINANSDYFDLNDSKNLFDSDSIKDIEFLSIIPVGNLDVEFDSISDIDAVYSISYSINGEVKKGFLTPTKDVYGSTGKYALKINSYIQKNQLVGMSDVHVEKATASELKEGLANANINKFKASSEVLLPSKYGGDQGDVDRIVDKYLNYEHLPASDFKKGELLNSLIDKYFPNVTTMQRIFLANHYANGGCAWMANANALCIYFGSIENGHSIFEERFGYKLTTEISSGETQYNYEIVAFEMYLAHFSTEYDNDVQKLDDSDEGGGLSPYNYDNTIGRFLEAKGISVKYETTDFTRETYDVAKDLATQIMNNPNGFNILSSKMFDIELLKSDSEMVNGSKDGSLSNATENNERIESVGAHAMLITEAVDLGVFNVTSWSYKGEVRVDSVKKHIAMGKDGYIRLTTANFSIDPISSISPLNQAVLNSDKSSSLDFVRNEDIDNAPFPGVQFSSPSSTDISSVMDIISKHDSKYGEGDALKSLIEFSDPQSNNYNNYSLITSYDGARKILKQFTASQINSIINSSKFSLAINQNVNVSKTDILKIKDVISKHDSKYGQGSALNGLKELVNPQSSLYLNYNVITSSGGARAILKGFSIQQIQAIINSSEFNETINVSNVVESVVEDNIVKPLDSAYIDLVPSLESGELSSEELEGIKAGFDLGDTPVEGLAEIVTPSNIELDSSIDLDEFWKSYTPYDYQGEISLKELEPAVVTPQGQSTQPTNIDLVPSLEAGELSPDELEGIKAGFDLGDTPVEGLAEIVTPSNIELDSSIDLDEFWKSYTPYDYQGEISLKELEPAVVTPQGQSTQPTNIDLVPSLEAGELSSEELAGIKAGFDLGDTPLASAIASGPILSPFEALYNTLNPSLSVSPSPASTPMTNPSSQVIGVQSSNDFQVTYDASKQLLKAVARLNSIYNNLGGVVTIAKLINKLNPDYGNYYSITNSKGVRDILMQFTIDQIEQIMDSSEFEDVYSMYKRSGFDITVADSYHEYSDYQDFVKDYKMEEEIWRKNLTDKQTEIINNYISESYQSSYRTMNRLARGILVDYDNKILRFGSGDNGALTFDEYVKAYNESVYSLVSRTTKEIAILDEVIRKNTLKKDTILYRGTTFDALSDLNALSSDSIEQLKSKLVGKTYTDKGFMSSSPPATGGFTHKEVRFVMECQAGTPFGNFSIFNPYEQEVLLALGTNFKINDVKLIEGKTFVYMTRIP